MIDLAPIVLVLIIAATLDWIWAEPPEAIHPIAWIGSVIAYLDRDWQRPLLVGGILSIITPLVTSGVVWALLTGLSTVSRNLTIVLCGGLLFTMISLRRLIDSANRIIVKSDTNTEQAREQLITLVGREKSSLSPAEIRSAAVESAAENYADGFIAPLLAFMIIAPVSLSLGGAAAVWVKTINTMDSMLGYQHKELGTAAARLDDLTMWLPARLSAGLLSVSAGTPDPVLTARRWAQHPDSPNAGWPMGTIAGALHVQLSKPDAYTLNPTASLPTTEQAQKGIQLVQRAGILAYAIGIIYGVILWM
ncbi:adenosylcobinamide-phosphate synthase CbiB [Salinarchaeum sp. IM2453]|uniref:adenosylcobinamide-phosphate synthase CbiB n=1 Tax=Salinarchaeum sp. IM2453 TaxID=2862870 RepID=UPI001C83CB20|nr:adenosylcobinamide-phosphate synthase CbiB [Salinarchaeum sp. IM2453]QZA87466.1 adenosylcobinamide-phosphate synthase CbiB [Salinarchaeum sp. IM2453]